MMQDSKSFLDCLLSQPHIINSPDQFLAAPISELRDAFNLGFSMETEENPYQSLDDDWRYSKHMAWADGRMSAVLNKLSTGDLDGISKPES